MNTSNTTDDKVSLPLMGRGVVKWFDPVKGYGFVESKDAGGEVLLHVNPLRDFGLSSVAKAVEIEFLFQKTSKGARITKVIDVSQSAVSVQITDLSDAEREALEPAVVKWYDATRGFGFMHLFKSSAEVFFYSAVLERSQVTSVIPGFGFAILVDRSGDRSVVEHIFDWTAAANI